MKFRFSDSGRVWEPRFGFTWMPMVGHNGFARHRIPRGVWLVLGALVLLFAGAAGAQGVALSDANPGMFDNIAEAYLQKARSWESGLRGVARGLFGGLAVISIAWTAIKLLLQKDDAKAFIPTMAMQCLTLGFFFYLVENGTQIASMVIASFEQSAARVGGTGSLKPSDVVINGFDCLFRIAEKIGDMGLSDSVALALPLMICGIILLLAFVGVAILFLVTVIESYFVLYGGIIMLGFGALPWTREIPKNYLIYAINVGVKLFVLYLVVGIGISFSTDWPAMVAGTEPSNLLQVVMYLLSGALVFLAVAWKVPGIAAALTSGALNFNASDAMGVTAAAAGVGAAAGAVTAGGATAVMEAARGGIQATTSGVALAAEQGASGIGAAIKGLGHAAGATASEFGSAAKAKVGLKPPSEHATDQRGRSIDNLGTRAANNLQAQTQAERESRAAAPLQGGNGNSTAGGSHASGTTGGEQASGQGSPQPQSTATQSAEATLPETESFKDGSDSQASRLKPPTLPPPDTANGGVTINLSAADD